MGGCGGWGGEELILGARLTAWRPLWGVLAGMNGEIGGSLTGTNGCYDEWDHFLGRRSVVDGFPGCFQDRCEPQLAILAPFKNGRVRHKITIEYYPAVNPSVPSTPRNRTPQHRTRHPPQLRRRLVDHHNGEVPGRGHLAQLREQLACYAPAAIGGPLDVVFSLAVALLCSESRFGGLGIRGCEEGGDGVDDDEACAFWGEGLRGVDEETEEVGEGGGLDGCEGGEEGV